MRRRLGPLHRDTSPAIGGALLVSPTRAAEMLGVSRAWMYRALATGGIPKVIMPGGRLIRVPVTALQEFAQQNDNAE